MSAPAVSDTNWLLAARKSHPDLVRPSEVPPRYRAATMEGVPHRALQEVASKYAASFWSVAPQGVAPLLLGSAQEYKTVTAAVLARAVRERCWIDVGWCNCAAEFSRFDRETYSEATRDRLQFLKTVPFLVMDDFSQVAQGSRMLSTLVEVGTERFDALRPTLWTGNLLITATDSSALMTAVGACLGRRMLEASAGFIATVRAKK